MGERVAGFFRAQHKDHIGGNLSLLEYPSAFPAITILEMWYFRIGVRGSTCQFLPDTSIRLRCF